MKKQRTHTLTHTHTLLRVIFTNFSTTNFYTDKRTTKLIVNVSTTVIIIELTNYYHLSKLNSTSDQN